MRCGRAGLYINPFHWGQSMIDVELRAHIRRLFFAEHWKIGTPKYEEKHLFLGWRADKF